MSTRELREAFNLVSEPIATCNRATLEYDRSSGHEVTFLEFAGNYADGAGFSIRSLALPSGADVIVAARDTAESLLKQRA